MSKEPKDSIACVASSVGVFVDANSGNDSNDGSKQNPVKTISHAIDLAKQKSLPRLYLCEGIFAEDVTLDTAHDGISIFGGWTCADWTYSGNKPTIGKTTTAFKLDTLTKTIFVEDVAIQAANAQNAGESSVGMWINGCANVNIVRDSIVAGSAKDGADGTTTIVSMPDAGTLKGNDTDGGLGAAANTVNCAAGGTTQGGKGGDVAIGGDAGLPALGGGAGGLGGATSCSSGQDGNSASSGSDGPGATAQGQLDSTGWSPGAGSTGTPGSPGQGGGGGGGVGGASFGGGGGGGAGGCGGAGGAAGGGGGGSIAMLVFNSGVTLTTTTLVATTAGNGGKGDAGQLGQAPGGHFGSSVNGCRGGNGGNGGNGGAGGGGAGGLSVGVLWKGPNAPTLDAQTLSTSKFGNAGIKGVGGSAGINDGVAGIAKAVLQVP